MSTLTLLKPEDAIIERKLGSRSLKARWILAENEDGSKECLTLSVGHFKNSKCYSATLYRTQTEEIYSRDTGEKIGSSEKFSLFAGSLTLLREPCARYSAKGLEATFEQAVAAFISVQEGDKVQQLIAQEA